MSENVSLQVESRQANVGAVPQANVGAVPQANVGAVPQPNVGAVPQANVGAVPQPNVGAVPQAAKQTVNVPLLVLENVKNILDICGDRGTFKTAEMYGVGLTYNEISKYISSSDQNAVKSV